MACGPCLPREADGRAPWDRVTDRGLCGNNRDPRRLLKITPIPFYQWPRQLIPQKEEVVACPSSKCFRLCPVSFNGILWFKLQRRNLTAAGDSKMQIRYMFRTNMKRAALSRQKNRNYRHLANAYDNSKIASPKTIYADSRGGNKVQSENMPFV